MSFTYAEVLTPGLTLFYQLGYYFWLELFYQLDYFFLVVHYFASCSLLGLNFTSHYKQRLRRIR